MNAAARAMDETYRDTEPMLKRLIASFQHKYGGDVDDMLDECQEVWVRAYQTHKPAQGSFETWLRFLAWKTLLERARTAARRNAKLKRNQMDKAEGVPVAAGFDTSTITAELTRDGQTLVEMILGDFAAMDLRLAANETNIAREGPRMKAALKSVCADLGWTLSRFQLTFFEVKCALENAGICLLYTSHDVDGRVVAVRSFDGLL